VIIEINGIVLKQTGNSSTQVVDLLTARSYRLFSLSFGRLESWNVAKHNDFSDTLCLPEIRVATALERLARAGFDLCD
jgi:hypothetical protein